MDNQQPYNYPLKHTCCRGSNIAYIDEGAGEALVFVHGYMCDLSLFRHAYTYFKDRYRVVGLDLPGAGYSEKPDIDYSPDYFADVLNEFIERIGLKKVTLIGLSMGGLVAIKAALNVPDRVERMVLIDCAGMVRFDEQMRMQVLQGRSEESAKRQDAGYFRQSAQFYFHACEEGYRMFTELIIRKTCEPDYPQLAVAQFRSFCSLTRDAAYIESELHRIACPVLILWGRNDRALPWPLAEKMAAALKHSSVAIADECGHIMALEKPDFMNEQIDKFLDQLIVR